MEDFGGGHKLPNHAAHGRVETCSHHLAKHFLLGIMGIPDLPSRPLVNGLMFCWPCYALTLAAASEHPIHDTPYIAALPCATHAQGPQACRVTGCGTSP